MAGMEDSVDSTEAPSQFLADVVYFLRDGGDDDAAYILEQSDPHVEFITQDEDMRWSIPLIDVTLYCPRLAYDMLRNFEHPLRQAIGYAIQALQPPDIDGYRMYVEVKRGVTSPDVQAHLLELVQKWGTGDDEESPAAGPDAIIDRELCFIIMSFSDNPQQQDFYEKAVKPAVKAMRYRCERVDEQQFNNSIRQKILDNIQHARFIIADMTEARPNCYYELGIAHALGKEVIHITRDMKDVHFDVDDFNFIVYGAIDELKRRLHERIRATIGPFQPR